MSLNYVAHCDDLSAPQDVCFDAVKTGNIYVADFGNDRIAVLDGDMNLKDEIGAGALDMVQGVGMRGENVMAVYSPRRLREYDANGGLVASPGITGSNQPQSVVYVPLTEDVLVADYANHQLRGYDTNYASYGNLGSLVTGLSSPGFDDFYRPSHVIFAEDQQVGPAIFLADTQNERILRIEVANQDAICKMTLDAGNTTVFEQGATPQGGSPFRPTSMAYSESHETIFAVDGYARVWAVDIRGNSVRQIYSNPGSAPDQLRNASGIAMIKDTYLVITDYTNNRATMFEL